MNNDFFAGVVAGMIFGVLLTMISLGIYSRIALSKKNTETPQQDPADWWKTGRDHPFDI